jgi:hypothetical protein
MTSPSVQCSAGEPQFGQRPTWKCPDHSPRKKTSAVVFGLVSNLLGNRRKTVQDVSPNRKICKMFFTKQALAIPDDLAEKTKHSVSSQFFRGANLLRQSAQPVHGPPHHNLRHLVAWPKRFGTWRKDTKGSQRLHLGQLQSAWIKTSKDTAWFMSVISCSCQLEEENGLTQSGDEKKSERKSNNKMEATNPNVFTFLDYECKPLQ